MSAGEPDNGEQKLPWEEQALIIDRRIKALERQQAEDKKEESEYKRRQLRFNRLLVWFTAALFLTSAVYDVFTFLLWRTTKISAEAATQGARAAEAAVQVARDTFTTTLTEMKAQSKAAQDGADATRKAVKIAEKSAQFAIESFRLDQRAWISVVGLRIEKEMKAGGFFDVSIIVKNSGKTPARNLRFSWMINLHKASGSTSTISGTSTAAEDLGPNVEYTAHILSNMPLITQTMIDGLESGETVLKISGEFTYLDVFEKTTRRVGYCGVFSPTDRPLLVSCPLSGG